MHPVRAQARASAARRAAEARTRALLLFTEAVIGIAALTFFVIALILCFTGNADL